MFQMAEKTTQFSSVEDNQTDFKQILEILNRFESRLCLVESNINCGNKQNKTDKSK